MLVCDGVSLLDVTHDEAGEAFKKAMDVHTVSACTPYKMAPYIKRYYDWDTSL